MKEIKLTQNKVALVDDEDFEYLNQRKWGVQKGKNTYYARACIKGDKTSMHRVIMQALRGQIIDHIDGNGLNNCKENLRFCTISENCRNRTSWKNSSSKYLGVDKFGDKYRACITLNYKTIHLGLFNTEIEAAISYNEAALKYHKSFANINKIEGIR